MAADDTRNAATTPDGWQIQVARSALLSEVLLLIAKTPDLNRLLTQAVNKLKWVIDFERCTLALLDDGGETYRLQTLLETRRTAPQVTEDNIPLARGLAGQVMHSRQTRLIANLAAVREKLPPLVDPALADDSLASLLSLPLQAYGKVLGAITFGAVKSNGLNDEDVKLATAFATHLALAIERWQQTEKLQQANQELARLASFPELNPGPIIEADLDGQIHYLNPAGRELLPDCVEAGSQHPLLADLPAVVANLHGDGQNSYLREIKIGQIWYQQVFHLVPDSQRIRFYVIDISERKRAEEAVKRQNEFLAALHETTLGLISRLDLNELLEALISRAGQLLGTPHGFVFLLDPGAEEIEQKVGTGTFARAIGFRLKRGEGVSGRVWQSGQPLVVTGYDSWEHRAPSFEYGVIDTVAAVPLKSDEEVVGTIGIAFAGWPD